MVVFSANTDRWPGASPDCWAESREVHQENHWRDHAEFVSVRSIPLSEFENRTYSRNGAYWTSWENERPDSFVIVYAEKERLSKIDFARVYGIEEPKWINEKLLYIRVWWGKIAATDFIFDVEKKEFIHSESLVSGYIAMSQFKVGCRIHPGCDCVKPEHNNELQPTQKRDASLGG